MGDALNSTMILLADIARILDLPNLDWGDAFDIQPIERSLDGITFFDRYCVMGRVVLRCLVEKTPRRYCFAFSGLKNMTLLYYSSTARFGISMCRGVSLSCKFSHVVDGLPIEVFGQIRPLQRSAPFACVRAPMIGAYRSSSNRAMQILSMSSFQLLAKDASASNSRR